MSSQVLEITKKNHENCTIKREHFKIGVIVCLLFTNFKRKKKSSADQEITDDSDFSRNQM